MAAPAMAWGKLHLFGLPDGSHVYGREFELLPSGTMFAAGVIMRGIVGMTAEVGDDDVARVFPNAAMRILAVRGTDQNELEIYTDDITEAYRIKDLQDAQS